jgi:methyl-accepting chemotaxis protein
MSDKRKQYYINELQITFVARFVLILIAASIIMGGVIYLLSLNTVTTAFENSRLIIKSTADFMLPVILLGTFIMIIVMSIITVIVTAVLTNRVVGPINRFSTFIDTVKDGYLNNVICLRGKDEILDLANKFNSMAREFCTKIDTVKKEMDRVSVLETEINELIKNESLDKAKLDSLLKEMFEIKSKISSQLEYFRTR